jgi:tetratricopeptide (TPR) repeat protein
MLGVALLTTIIPFNKKWQVYLSFGVLLALGVVTYNRIQIWQSNKTFFMDMLKNNPFSYSAHLNMGNVEKNNRDFQTAIGHFEKAHDIRPTELGPIAGKMMILGTMGNLKALESLFLEYQPKLNSMRTTGPHLSVFYAMLGHARLQQQRLEDAFQLFCESYKYDPSYHDGRRNLEAIAQHLMKNNKPVPNCPVR